MAKEQAPDVQPVTVDLLAQVLQNLPKGITADDLSAILASQREATKAEQEATRVVRHSNADHEHKSVFSYPEGDLKRAKPFHQTPDGRKREVYFNGTREREDQLTPEEILAYNAITESREGRDGRWTAKIDTGGRRLRLTVPSYTLDERMDVPPLVLVLREMAQGAKSIDPLMMASRLAALEKALAEKGVVVPA